MNNIASLRKQIIQLIDESPLQRISEELKPLLKPGIRVRTQKADENKIEPGASRMGGKPHFPDGLEWPRFNGTPLAFIAQFNLEEAASFDVDGELPHSGMLYIFYEASEQPPGAPEDRGAWRVIYYNGDMNILKMTAPPEDIPSDSRFRAKLIEMTSEIQLPDPFSNIIDELDLKSTFREDEGDELYQYEKLRQKVTDLYGDSEVIHKLLGYSHLIQGDIKGECHEGYYNIQPPPLTEEEMEAQANLMIERMNAISSGEIPEKIKKTPDQKALLREAEKWRLLFQADSEVFGDMMWGDTGRLYFCITEEALKQKNFDEVWMVMQCY